MGVPPVIFQIIQLLGYPHDELETSFYIETPTGKFPALRTPAPRDQFVLELLRSPEAGQLDAQKIDVDLGDQMVVQWLHPLSSLAVIGRKGCENIACTAMDVESSIHLKCVPSAPMAQYGLGPLSCVAQSSAMGGGIRGAWHCGVFKRDL